MAKGIGHLILIIKAILTRVIFATHGFVAIWRVTSIKNDPYYWYLCSSIFCLAFEGVFTLTIKKNQEWKWFCPSVFFYLCSVVPAIWLLEVDKFDRKLALKIQTELNLTGIKVSNEELAAIETFGVELKIPVQLDAETWATVIEQLLMLILIIGRWMLPKGGLTRDQLSQLLLVYIGTAADIIEFFDSFKDDKISSQRILCLLILSIWSWSLLQFTFVLTATKARRTRITADIDPPKPKFVNGIYKVKEVCCSIDVWGILINIILQDAPFLIFRMLLITYYKIISYMNIFFTCKNTLVIILQFYRLYVVQQEKNKELSKMAKATVSGNLAKAVERAAFIGPTDPKIKPTKQQQQQQQNLKRGTTAAAVNAKKCAIAFQSSSSQPNQKKHRSQESIISRRNERILEAARRERAKTGRRKSLSTGNLPTAGDESLESVDTFPDPDAIRTIEDDIELGMGMSLISGTNDGDSVEESEAPLDDISFTSELPASKHRQIRMKDSPGIYKTGSRSSAGSSDRRCRQDTGYSSSSKDSANSSRRGRLINGGSRTGRAGGSRSRSAAQRRRQMVMAKALNSEFGGMFPPESSSSSEDLPENERIFQRRAAICAVFSLFVVIFILCMVAIYGGINPKGLVLRETFRVANSTKPKTTTTTPPPPSNTTLINDTTTPPQMTISILVSADNSTVTIIPKSTTNSVIEYGVILTKPTTIENSTFPTKLAEKASTNFVENNAKNSKSTIENSAFATTSTKQTILDIVSTSTKAPENSQITTTPATTTMKSTFLSTTKTILDIDSTLGLENSFATNAATISTEQTPTDDVDAKSLNFDKNNLRHISPFADNFNDKNLHIPIRHVRNKIRKLHENLDVKLTRFIKF